MRKLKMFAAVSGMSVFALPAVCINAAEISFMLAVDTSVSKSPDFIIAVIALAAAVVLAVFVIALLSRTSGMLDDIEELKKIQRELKKDCSDLSEKASELEESLRRTDKNISRLAQQRPVIIQEHTVKETAAQPDVSANTKERAASVQDTANQNKTDDERCLDFFNGGSAEILPETFSVVKLSMNGGSVFTDPSGYDCYIYGSADTTGIVKLYPGKVSKSPNMRTYYNAVFDFVSEGKTAVSVVPCEAERNAYGAFKIISKGKVFF